MKYLLTCSNCDLRHTHESDSIDAAREFWNNWNRGHGEDVMKCIHEYEFEELK
jgi:hypothetical protein